MTVETIQCEMWLLGWNEHHKRGATVTMQIHAEDLESFRALTVAKGKVAGQRFVAVLAMVADDESPEKLPPGPLCKLAAIWCRDLAFQVWLARTWPTLWNEIDTGEKEEAAKHVVCRVCEVTSRKQLDHDAEARRAFTELIRRPYMAHLSERAA